MPLPKHFGLFPTSILFPGPHRYRRPHLKFELRGFSTKEGQKAKDDLLGVVGAATFLGFCGLWLADNKDVFSNGSEEPTTGGSPFNGCYK